MKLVINKCYGGFGLSDAAYEKLIEWGVPLRDYIKEKRNPETGCFERVPENEGEVIFREKGKSLLLKRSYWDTWTRESRNHPLVVRAVEELGEKASGELARLEVIEIPDDVDYVIEEYDGFEWVTDAQRRWG